MSKAPAGGLQGQDLFNKGIQEAQNVSENDKELWGLITDVPRLNGIWVIVCAVLNVGMAGTGTMVAAVVGDKNGWNKTQLAVGFIQLITSVYIIGWLLSIYWAYLLVTKAYKDNQAVKAFLDKTEPKSEFK